MFSQIKWLPALCKTITEIRVAYGELHGYGVPMKRAPSRLSVQMDSPVQTKKTPTGLCRDCLTPLYRPANKPPLRRCPTCSKPRLLTHPELFDLSIAHLDCDAFYASVEKRDNPDLHDKPLIIGGGETRRSQYLLLHCQNLRCALSHASFHSQGPVS